MLRLQPHQRVDKKETNTNIQKEGRSLRGGKGEAQPGLDREGKIIFKGKMCLILLYCFR